MYDKATKERFYTHVKKSGDCELWTGAKNAKGYGIFSVNGETKRAIRVVYEMEHGAIPAGKQVMHATTCANTSCVKLAHLSLGTNAENATERATREALNDFVTEMYVEGDLTLEEALKMME
jgi:hypothetical protein